MSERIKFVRQQIQQMDSGHLRWGNDPKGSSAQIKLLEGEWKNELSKILLSASGKSSFKITINYAGSCDDGDIEEIQGLDLPGQDHLIEDFFYGVCYKRISGFENNEGGGGTVTIASRDGVVEVQHHHYWNTESWEVIKTVTVPCESEIVDICKRKGLAEVRAEFFHEDLYIDAPNREAESLLYPLLQGVCERIVRDYFDPGEDSKLDLIVDPIMDQIEIAISEIARDQETSEFSY